MNRKLFGFCFAAALAVSPHSTLFAVDNTWLGVTSAWGEASNWSEDAIPTASYFVFFNGTATHKDVVLSSSSFASRLTFEGTDDYLFTSSSFTLQSSNGITHNGSGDVVFNTLVSFGNSSNRDINGTGTGTISLNSNIKGNSGIRISGSGAFRVLVNGVQESTNNTNSITNGAATLGGNGSLSRSLAVAAAGATIAPGVDGVAGDFTLEGGFSSQVATHFDFDLGGTAGAGDRLLITGGTFLLRSAAAGSFVLNLSDLGSSPVDLETPITLIDVASTGVTLDFSTVTSAAFAIGDLPAGWVLDSGYGTGGILFNPSTGDLSVQFSAIPEPATCASLGIGFAVLMAGSALRRRATASV